MDHISLVVSVLQQQVKNRVKNGTVLIRHVMHTEILMKKLELKLHVIMALGIKVINLLMNNHLQKMMKMIIINLLQSVKMVLLQDAPFKIQQDHQRDGHEHGHRMVIDAL